MAKQPLLNDDERAELIAYLDGELEEEAARAVEAKLNRDPRLRAEAETLRRAWDLLDYLPRPEPSTDFTSRTVQRISVQAATRGRARGRWRTWTLGAGWAAAVLLAAGASYNWTATHLHRQATRLEEPIDVDQLLVRDLRVLENKRLYDQVDSLEFLRKLDSPELFGDES